MDHSQLDALRLELSVKAKNGLDFIIAATLVWVAIAAIWTLQISAYNRSVLTFIAGGVMLPMAFVLSKILKTNWKIESNPLQPLGLVLNFAQLFYFSFLVFVLLKSPDYFVMTYAIITGAHFFPYAWYYKEKGYAVMAGIISLGSLLIALNVEAPEMYKVAIFMVCGLLVLCLWLFLSLRSKQRSIVN